jgi:hypothetical protein
VIRATAIDTIGPATLKTKLALIPRIFIPASFPVPAMIVLAPLSAWLDE